MTDIDPCPECDGEGCCPSCENELDPDCEDCGGDETCPYCGGTGEA